MGVNGSVAGLSPESHLVLDAGCDFGTSTGCRGTWKAQYRELRKIMDRNGGKIICLQCSRLEKFSGRNNPNSKYSLDDDALQVIDTEGKAYFLGWVASDGHIAANGSITIAVAERDRTILNKLQGIVGSNAPIKTRSHIGPEGQQWQDLASVTFSSKRMCADALSHLGLSSAGWKSGLVEFPTLPNTELKWAFFRGLFDGDGSVARPHLRRLRTSLASTSPKMRAGVRELLGNLPCYENSTSISWEGTNALDMLGKLYSDATYYLPRKRDLFLDWATWEPALSGTGRHGKELLFSWNKTDPRACAPFKERVSDSGYDLTLVDVKARYGKTTLYDTKLRITTEFGYFFMLAGRSSLHKLGYTLANGVGIIDRSYVGNILAPLLKFDESAPDLELPARVLQIIPFKVQHLTPIEALDIEQTGRSDGGFGSTGK